MSLLFGKHCKDGILFVADGVARSSGAVGATPTGKKTLAGIRFGNAYSIAFAGYAGRDDRKSTLDYLKEAAAKEGSLQDNVRDAVWAAYSDAVAHPLTDEDLKDSTEAQRCEAMEPPLITAYISIRSNEWWIASADPGGANRWLQDTTIARASWPTPEALAGLQPLLIHAPLSIAEATTHFAELFGKTAEMAPSHCMYPGVVCSHRNSGVTMNAFNNSVELVALGTR